METTPQNPRPGLVELAAFGVENANFFRAIRRRGTTRARLCLVDLLLGKLDRTDALYVRRVAEFDQATIELHKGKWYATEASRTGSKATWAIAFEAFDNASRLADELLVRLEGDDPGSVVCVPSKLESRGTEIVFADGVPLVPEITPIVFLQGSDYAMGQQYAQQLVKIFGAWILERHTGQALDEADRAELSRWEDEHRRHTPWVLAFCRGWAAGANELGIPMTYEDVLDLWVGHKPPAADYLGSGGLPMIPPMLCSGVAAWGRATSDGQLVTGSTGDHDLSYQITIVGFPDEGHRFIYSPFGATGEIGGAGAIWFFGHPAINDQGLAYVHHGGGPKFLEPREHWGYGIRRAASVIHVLRFCETAHQALALEQSWPIGDVGLGDQATVGGFYADGTYAYVLEGRRDPEAVRESGLLGERDFLYANNSVAHPRAIESAWMASDQDAWTWDGHGGWRPKTPTGMTKSLGLMVGWASGRLSTSDLLRRGMRFAATNSCARNRYLFKKMDEGFGKIDLDYMKGVYRSGGSLPEGPWRRIERAYVRKGTWGEVSAAHASNAMTVVTRPREGIYCLCTGPARRGLAPMMPGSATTIHAETNTFWELKLDETPAKVMEHARIRAREHLESARDELRRQSATAPLDPSLASRVELAAALLDQGEGAGASGALFDLARATRLFTQAQVRAQQVYEALVPP